MLATQLVISPQARAATYYGRITSGGFVSKETFAHASDGQTSNDFLTASARLFYRISDLGDSKVETTIDLRDKNDFFDKLDRERLLLTSKNTFQARQLSIALPNNRGPLYGIIGRFPVSEAGPVHVDGAEAGLRWSPTFRASVFGGYNPERPDQTSLQYNPDSQVLGAYAVLQPKPGESTYFYMNNAAVVQRVSGHTDRLFWANHFVYRWKSPNSVTGLFNFDFVPRSYLQFASLSWFQEWLKGRSSTVNLTAFDVIQYSRRQGVLETLPPSPYREAALRLRHRMNSVTTMNLNFSHGLRLNDLLQRTELSAGPSFLQFISRHFSAEALLGYRRNFTSRDTFFRFDLGWYSRFWEINFNGEAGIRVEPGLSTLHPVLTELGIAHFFSKGFYGTASIQDAWDERVNIVSGFVKFGYRFGSQDVAPLRDGAPPRGHL
ncbi:MAG: hypothetical protein A2X97_15675 [Bdellovibrionales bacterium GWA1_52_35]|nr:MAG: hypothetical protein A2X97_15675 [Bdellovibrionales bacterium GWA1_52_35]HCM39728.1 hypothetical protein [Bdellovibrionales bacterium]